MRITELMIGNFGKINKKKVIFSKGINVVLGENEAGKTTVYSFIKAMFFDIERKRGRAARTDEFVRYEPWENSGRFGGSLRFSTGEKQFIIHREFQKHGKKSELFCEDDGELLSIEDGDLEVLLGGIDAANFENTVCIGQGKVETSEQLKEQLKNYAANYHDTKNEEVVIKEIIEDLKGKKKTIEENYLKYREKKLSIIQRIKAQEEFLEREIIELEDKSNELGELESDVDSSLLTKSNGALLIGLFGIASILSWFFLWKPLNYIVVAAWIGLAIFVTIKEWKKRDEYKIYNRDAERKEWEKQAIEEQIEEKRIVLENLNERLVEESLPTKTDDEYESDKVCISLAMEKVVESASSVQKEFGAKLNTIASEVLEYLTENRYQQMFVDEDLKVTIITEGRLISVNQLSRGTIEQVYFALRIAVAEVMQEEKLPIIFDDAFGHYDSKRLKRLFQWLEKCERQVVIFSCQERERDILEEMGILYNEINI